LNSNPSIVQPVTSRNTDCATIALVSTLDAQLFILRSGMYADTLCTDVAEVVNLEDKEVDRVADISPNGDCLPG
jgi:hypothetical protein